jgi:hypothetical protein
MAKTNEYRPSHFQDWRNDPDKARPLTNTLPSRLTDHVAVANSYRGETCEGALDLPDGRTLVVWENMPAFIVDRVVVLNEEQTILAKQAYFQKYESAFAGLRSLVPLAPQSAKDRLGKRREQAQKAQDTGVLLADVIDEG